MKETIITRNRLEGLLQNTVRSFSEFGWMLAAEDQELVRMALERARTAVTSDDGTEVRQALERLENAARLITDAMFRPAQGTAASPESPADNADRNEAVS